jgi:hypothetical protein
MDQKMLTFIKEYSRNFFSQNGEDGVINEICKRIKLSGVAIEFGGHDGYFCSNVRLLAEWDKWKILQYDIDPGNAEVIEKAITDENINDLPTCQLMSIDIDGNDFNVWKGLKSTPDVIIIEINSGLRPMEDFFHPSHGSNYSQMVKLGIEKGYFLIGHTGNLIFVLNKYRDLFPEIEGDGLSNYWLYFNSSWL